MVDILDLAPILLSMVALYISLLTQKQQTRVALFDKRYELYHRAKEIIKFKNEIAKLKHPQFQTNNGINFDFANSYFALWTGNNQSFCEELNNIESEDIVRQFGIINGRKNNELKELDKIELLYFLDENREKILINFCSAYEKFVNDMILISYGIDKSVNILGSKEEFCKAAELFEDNLINPVLRKFINVTKI